MGISGSFSSTAKGRQWLAAALDRLFSFYELLHKIPHEAELRHTQVILVILPMKLPDGPKTPRWLQKIQWTIDPLSFMDTAVQRYGDIFNAPVIGNTATLLLVSNPQALQQIFSSDTKQFTAPSNQLLQPLVGDRSMFVLEGDRHRRERKLVMPPFHGDRMRAYGQLIVELTEKGFAQLVPNKPFTARTVMQDISMEVILKVVFGLSEGERFRQLKQRITALMDSTLR